MIFELIFIGVTINEDVLFSIVYIKMKGVSLLHLNNISPRMN